MKVLNCCSLRLSILNSPSVSFAWIFSATACAAFSDPTHFAFRFPAWLINTSHLPFLRPTLTPMVVPPHQPIQGRGLFGSSARFPSGTKEFLKFNHDTVAKEEFRLEIVHIYIPYLRRVVLQVLTLHRLGIWPQKITDFINDTV